MKDIKIFWKEIIEEKVIKQLENCMIEWSIWVLTADAHYGYSMPVGWCIAYENHISLSWVGFDIGCGNKAVKTNILAKDIDIKNYIQEIQKVIGFWVGRPNPNPIDHPVLEKINKSEFIPQRWLLELASQQLGTIGSWNHYVDIFVDRDWYIWVWVHFWSRGFWHKTTTWFIALSQGLKFHEHATEWSMDSKPILFDMSTQIWQDYFYAMGIAWEYAYAWRDRVCDTVVSILWWVITDEVHNHHNFAWKENHFWKDYYVVRKWCTPAFDWQRGFVWSNMFDKSFIIEWVDTQDSKEWLYSTVHWAWRIMGRREAAWSWKKKWWVRTQVKEGKVDFEKTKQTAKERGVILVWAWADESPECYKELEEVLHYQWDTVKITNRLNPILVMMAGAWEFDPYKD